MEGLGLGLSVGLDLLSQVPIEEALDEHVLSKIATMYRKEEAEPSYQEDPPNVCYVSFLKDAVKDAELWRIEFTPTSRPVSSLLFLPPPSCLCSFRSVLSFHPFVPSFRPFLIVPFFFCSFCFVRPPVLSSFL
jgi:hypothetical protein